MNIEKTWYVYLLCDPDTEEPFYVGKGTGERMHTHEKTLNTRYDSNAMKKEIIRKILAQGKQVLKKKVAEFDNEKDAYACEVALIKQYKDQLTNMKPGGGRLYPDKPKPRPQEINRVKHQHIYTDADPYMPIKQIAEELGWKRGQAEWIIVKLGIKKYKFEGRVLSWIAMSEVEKLKDYKANPWKYAKQGKSSEEAA